MSTIIPPRGLEIYWSILNGSWKTERIECDCSQGQGLDAHQNYHRHCSPAWASDGLYMTRPSVPDMTGWYTFSRKQMTEHAFCSSWDASMRASPKPHPSRDASQHSSYPPHLHHQWWHPPIDFCTKKPESFLVLHLLWLPCVVLLRLWGFELILHLEHSTQQLTYW